MRLPSTAPSPDFPSPPSLPPPPPPRVVLVGGLMAPPSCRTCPHPVQGFGFGFRFFYLGRTQVFLFQGPLVEGGTNGATFLSNMPTPCVGLRLCLLVFNHPSVGTHKVQRARATRRYRERESESEKERGRVAIRLLPPPRRCFGRGTSCRTCPRPA